MSLAHGQLQATGQDQQRTYGQSDGDPLRPSMRIIDAELFGQRMHLGLSLRLRNSEFVPNQSGGFRPVAFAYQCLHERFEIGHCYAMRVLT